MANQLDIKNLIDIENLKLPISHFKKIDSNTKYIIIFKLLDYSRNPIICKLMIDKE
jgi:hypothetical protein